MRRFESSRPSQRFPVVSHSSPDHFDSFPLAHFRFLCCVCSGAALDKLSSLAWGGHTLERRPLDVHTRRGGRLRRQRHDLRLGQSSIAWFCHAAVTTGRQHHVLGQPSFSAGLLDEMASMLKAVSTGRPPTGRGALGSTRRFQQSLRNSKPGHASDKRLDLRIELPVLILKRLPNLLPGFVVINSDGKWMMCGSVVGP